MFFLFFSSSLLSHSTGATGDVQEPAYKENKFQSEGTRSKVTLATGYRRSPTCYYRFLNYIIGARARHLGGISPRICRHSVPDSNDPVEVQTSQSVSQSEEEDSSRSRSSVSGLFVLFFFFF